MFSKFKHDENVDLLNMGQKAIGITHLSIKKVQKNNLLTVNPFHRVEVYKVRTVVYFG